MTLFELVVFCLATWRVASLLTREAGPFHIFTEIRKWTGIQHDEAERPYMIPETFWAELFSCVWCSAIWIGATWFVFWLLYPPLAVQIATIFAIAAGALLVEKYLMG